MNKLTHLLYLFLLFGALLTACKHKKTQPTSDRKIFVDSIDDFKPQNFNSSDSIKQDKLLENIEAFDRIDDSLSSYVASYESAKSIPVDPNEADPIHDGADHFIDKDNKKIKGVQFRINLQDILNYYFSLGIIGTGSGLRIYPAYDGDLGFIICVCEKYDGKNLKEEGYVFVKKNYGYNGFFHSGMQYLTKDQAIPLIKEYTKIIRYYESGKPQQLKDTIRISKFYDWSFVDSLYKQNLKIGESYEKYSIRFKYGYVNPRLAARIWGKYHEALTNRYMTSDKVGGLTFTLTMYRYSSPLLGSNGYGMGVKDYKGKILEVANPCPPQCGQITQDDIWPR